MNFAESVKYLYSLGNEVAAMKLGLEATEKLFAALGNPQRDFLKIQIAGTNGKGSTCAFLDAICRRARIETGLYTSPHLISICERIRINGAEISEENFAVHATRVREISENLVASNNLETIPTFFEQMTAIAVSAFGEVRIELAILETGLGGRFDSVTAARAEIAAITPIDLDHQQILGDTLEKIAAEKAAIIHENSKVVLANQKSGALKEILKRCREKNVSPLFAACEIFIEDLPEIGIKTNKNLYSNVTLSLIGEHQRENACVAVNLAEILISDFKFEISNQNIVEGLKAAKHAGRLEWREYRKTKFLFDGAHNVAGAKALEKYLRENFADSKITMIFGAMQDKEISEIARILFPLAADLILTEPDNSRSETIENLRTAAEKFVDKSKIFSVETVAAAIDAAMLINQNYDRKNRSFVCVTGSLYLIGEAQSILNTSF